MVQQDPNPKPVLQVVITVMSNGSVSVAGFPKDNHVQSMHILGMAGLAVTDFFIRKTEAGEYPEKKAILSPTAAQVVGLGKKQ